MIQIDVKRADGRVTRLMGESGIATCAPSLSENVRESDPPTVSFRCASAGELAWNLAAIMAGVRHLSPEAYTMAHELAVLRFHAPADPEPSAAGSWREAMRPVAPRVGCPEVTMAEDQHEYMPVTVAVVTYEDGDQAVMTRWRLDDDERAKIAAGEDLYLTLLTFGQPMQPITLEVGPPAWARPTEERGST